MIISRTNGLLQNAISTVSNQPIAENPTIPNFQSILDKAQSSEDAATTYDNYMNGPEHPFNIVCYLAEGVTFPPSDASPEFLLAWNQTLNSMPEAERGLLCCHIMDALEYGDYHGATVDEAQRTKNIMNRLNCLDCQGVMELAVKSQRHMLEDSIAAGNELNYIRYLQYCVSKTEEIINLYTSMKSANT